ncbi:FBP domain-containing protein [Herbiconiux moechotypicola]|uniref:FBP domain-containing protein n=1 Tax=Herbiconiux moechotypicola TaxID=637393 RepID=A0ABN3DHM4_9MICO|nr:FBP domain-containing protein [Herbiconiux moechotypicola]MCS5729566.1 FBP domain-containing protein [Herbiconiux moechotypicola]
MLSLTEQQIRASFVNASRKEVSDVTLPPDFETLSFDSLDYLGWHDRKLARRSYVVAEVDGEPVGVVLKQSDKRPLSRAQCSWCSDVNLTNEVVFYSAKRAGAAGRNGNTIGTLICADFGCSANVRKLPPMAYIGFDAEAARLDNITGLQLHAEAFARSVRQTS